MISRKKATYPYIVVLFLLGFMAPLVLKEYQVYMLTEIIIFALYAVSYNLLLGYAGLLSFGHAMFFGTGAFTVAVSLIHIPGLPVWGAILIAILATTLVGFVTGGFLLRHKGAYFALLTLAFNALFYAVATKWSAVTGGDDGLSVTRPDIHLGFTTINTAGTVNFYYVTLVVMGAAIVFCWYLTRTAMGQTVLLMRENEERMKFLGYDTNISRLILFTFYGGRSRPGGRFLHSPVPVCFHLRHQRGDDHDGPPHGFRGGNRDVLGAYPGSFRLYYSSELPERPYRSLAAFHGAYFCLYGPGDPGRAFSNHTTDQRTLIR